MAKTDITKAEGDLFLENLTKSFGDFNAVNDLSLQVPQGSFFALLGPSGCGKTTTLRMVSGLEDPTAGRIRIGDADITHQKPYKRPVNTVFQNYALFPHMTIEENVAFGLRRRGVKDVDKQVADALRPWTLDFHVAQNDGSVFSWSPEPKTAPSLWATWKASVHGRRASATCW